MADKPSSTDYLARIRKEAENRLKARPPEPITLSGEDIPELVHQMRLQQMELEIQNEQLREQQKLLDISQQHYANLSARYASLYDFAPVGYLTIHPNGQIQNANVTIANMLGVPRGELLGRGITEYIHSQDHEIFLQHQARLRKAGGRVSHELRLIKATGGIAVADFHGMRFHGTDLPADQIRLCIIDVSKRAQEEKNQALILSCLKIANRSQDMQSLMDALVKTFKNFAGCEAVGIRIRQEDGRIPYQAYDGFSRAFYERENLLSVNQDQCLCIYAIQGRVDPNLSITTPNGSYYVNGTSRFLASAKKAEAGVTRNVCNQFGYESVALVPIPMYDRMMGLIHVADRRPDMVPLALVEGLEGAALQVGLAMQRLYVQEQLHASSRELRHVSGKLVRAREDEKKHISAELHDHIGQNLNVLKLRLTSVHNQLRRDQPKLKAECRRLLDLMDQIIADTRGLAYGLSPCILEDLGLTAALKWLVSEFTQRCEIDVRADLIELDAGLDAETQLHFFRIVQEVLNNVAKHAGASQVRLRFRQYKDALAVLISDNGQGFDPTEPIGSGTEKKGLGLSAMQLRARMIGASLRVRSRKGKGTWIHIHLPVESRGEA